MFHSFCTLRTVSKHVLISVLHISNSGRHLLNECLLCAAYFLFCVSTYFVMISTKMAVLASELFLAFTTTMRGFLDHILRTAELWKLQEQYKLFSLPFSVNHLPTPIASIGATSLV